MGAMRCHAALAASSARARALNTAAPNVGRESSSTNCSCDCGAQRSLYAALPPMKSKLCIAGSSKQSRRHSANRYEPRVVLGKRRIEAFLEEVQDAVIDEADEGTLDASLNLERPQCQTRGTERIAHRVLEKRSEARRECTGLALRLPPRLVQLGERIHAGLSALRRRHPLELGNLDRPGDRAVVFGTDVAAHRLTEAGLERVPIRRRVDIGCAVAHVNARTRPEFC